MKSRTIFIKPVGNNCNMSCVYCFEKNDKWENGRDSLSVEDTITYLEKFVTYDHVFIVFHGGEPLLAGNKYYKSVLDYILNTFSGTIHVQIQTNGSLLNEEWIALLRTYRDILSISISIDPIGRNDLRYQNNDDLRTRVINNIYKITSEFENTGIIAVMHKYNRDCFINFIEELCIPLKIKNITINKFRYDAGSKFSVTEEDYTKELIKITDYWIRKKLYRSLHIQPLNALLSNHNKICLFLNDVNKCRYFSVLEPGMKYEHCYHIQHPRAHLDKKCEECSILDFCGGGCLAEKNDDDFCKGRFILHDFIGRLKP